MEILQPQCLIFVLPLLVGVVLVLLNALGLSGVGHGDLHIEHDVDLHPHVEVGHDAHVDHDAGHHANALTALLQLLGLGRVPLSILIISFCFIWGAGGLVFLKVLGLGIGRACLFAAITAAVGTRLLAEGIAALIPGDESYSTSKEDLVGESAQALYQITEISGSIRLLDLTGNLLDLPARTRGGLSIKPGTQVVITAYDPAVDLFYVETP